MITQTLINALTRFIKKETDLAEVYDYWIAPSEADCPYAVILESYDRLIRPKDGEVHDIDLTIHLWSDRIDKRSELHKIETKIKEISKGLVIEGHSIVLTDYSARFITDTTTGTPYLHGVLYLTYLV